MLSFRLKMFPMDLFRLAQALLPPFSRISRGVGLSSSCKMNFGTSARSSRAIDALESLDLPPLEEGWIQSSPTAS